MYSSILAQSNLFPEVAFNERELKPSIWTRLVKQRDCFTCQFSLDDSFRVHDGPIEAHHIYPIKYWGKYVISNGITLCEKCHAQFLIEAEQKYYSGVMQKYYLLLKDFVRGIIFLPKQSQYYKLLGYLSGSHEFRDSQLDAIKTLTEEHRNLIFVSPTGSGKSIIYQLYGVLSQAQMLVLSPLMALQKNQVQSLWKRWIPATLINSTLGKKEKNQRLQNIINASYSFVFAHPKQFLAKNNQTGEIELKLSNSLLSSPFKSLCIDEAHVIDTWGKSFIEEYSKLRILRKHLQYPQTILLSATLTKKQQRKIANDLFLEDEKPKIIVTGFYRPEISLHVIEFDRRHARKRNREEYIDMLLRENVGKKTIIFATTKSQVEDLTSLLKQKGHDVEGYHSGMGNDTKSQIQDRFSGKIQPEIQILVCTSAFGMGINIPNIRLGIHYSLPFSVNDYYQQFGRIGRDGQNSDAYLLHDLTESTRFIDFIEEKQLENVIDEQKKAELISIFEAEKQVFANYINCTDKWRFILDYFGEDINISKFAFWITFFNNFIKILVLGFALVIYIYLIKTLRQ